MSSTKLHLCRHQNQISFIFKPIGKPDHSSVHSIISRLPEILVMDKGTKVSGDDNDDIIISINSSSTSSGITWPSRL